MDNQNISLSGEKFKRCLNCNDRLLDPKEQYCSSCIFDLANAKLNREIPDSDVFLPFNKIGGVLYIVAAILFLGIFIKSAGLYIFYQTASTINLELWFFLFCLAGYVVDLMLICYTTLLFVRKKKKTKPFFILFASFQFIFQACFFSILYFHYRTPPDSDVIQTLVRSLNFAIIWISYFLLSKRVKHTFTH
jgi:hypothetical protein